MTVSNPIQLTIPIIALRQTKKLKFHHASSATELTELAKLVGIERMIRLYFQGHLIQNNKESYSLEASIKAEIIQLCIISLTPVKTKIDQKIKQFFSIRSQENAVKQIAVDYYAEETEQIFDEVNIGDIILETLNLEIPLYPKKKGAYFNGVTITEGGIKPFEPTSNNPFSSLKKLR